MLQRALERLARGLTSQHYIQSRLAQEQTARCRRREYPEHQQFWRAAVLVNICHSLSVRVSTGETTMESPVWTSGSAIFHTADCKGIAGAVTNDFHFELMPTLKITLYQRSPHRRGREGILNLHDKIPLNGATEFPNLQGQNLDEVSAADYCAKFLSFCHRRYSHTGDYQLMRSNHRPSERFAPRRVHVLRCAPNTRQLNSSTSPAFTLHAKIQSRLPTQCGKYAVGSMFLKDAAHNIGNQRSNAYNICHRIICLVKGSGIPRFNKITVHPSS